MEGQSTVGGRASTMLARFGRGVAALTTRASAAYSPSGILVATVLIGGALLVASSVVASYHGVDVVSSVSFIPEDAHCPNDDPSTTGLGVHCFSDYYQVVDFTQSENPWSERKSNYSAAGMLPNAVTGWIGDVSGSPRVGLATFLVLLTAALVTPAVWASRHKSLTLRLVALGAFGILTVPALSALDRGNSAALAVPALLAFLIAVRRGNYATAVIALSAASLIRPQFLILIAVLWALRKWRLSVIALLSVGLSNLIAYAAWPKAFPQTLVDSVIAVLRYGRQYSMADNYPPNVSLGKGFYELYTVLFGFGGEAPGELRLATYGGVVGFIVATTVILFVMALGPKLPGLLSAILILMSATLFPGATWSYSLSACLAIAAVMLRDPLDVNPERDRWRGALDMISTTRAQRIAVGLVALATATSLTRLILPSLLTVDPLENPGGQVLVGTTASLAPVLWILASFAVVGAWGLGRREGISARAGDPQRTEEASALIGSEEAAR